MKQKLVEITKLAELAPKFIDPRARNADGKLRHVFADTVKRPIKRAFIRAETKIEGGVKWFYRSWHPAAGEASCGYSGQSAHAEKTFVLVFPS